jgi:hypothetical protein
MGGVASHDFSSLTPSIKVGSKSFYFHVSKSWQAFQQEWGWKILLTSCEAKFICGTRGHPALYLITQPRKDIVEQFQVKIEAPTLPSCSFLVINCELPHNPSSKKNANLSFAYYLYKLYQGRLILTWERNWHSRNGPKHLW